MMSNRLVITLSGPDRPGLVEALSKTVAAHGGNWQRSHMAHLGGRFAGLLEVTLAPEQVAPLTEQLTAIEALEIAVADAGAEEPTPERTLTLEIIGNDHPGIVRDIFRVFAECAVNVEELESTTESAAESGAPLFRAVARLGCSRDTDLDALQGRLEAIASDIMVDARLQT